MHGGTRAGMCGITVLRRPPAPVLIWYLLVAAGVGPQSLSNIVELFIIAVAVLALAYVRVFVLDRLTGSPKTNAIVILALSVIVPIVLRLTMPVLPE